MSRSAQVGLVVVFLLAGAAHAATSVSGELRKWHKVTLTFDGPSTSETANPNPFTDYRLNVTFTNGGTTYVVPGYYCADGNAANSNASSGNKWRVHFAPDKIGTWSYSVSFRTGSNVATNDSATAGSSAGFMDGETGSFSIQATNKTGRDMRAKGRLEYVGEHYLRFAETGAYFFKQGADAPENFLAYQDFDGPFKSDGQKDNLIKDWAPHISDWQTGDPTWDGGKGKGIIGAINYLASEGLNVFSFLPMNINGDDRNVFPYLNYNERYRMDCSRLDQWEIVFEHGTKKGFFLHFKTQETENELLLDSGNLGNQRKLYYRELIARFSHHLALNWNLGEEINDASTAQKQAWAQYFYDNDPYHHHIVIHNGSNHYELLGNASKLTGFSKQTNLATFANVHSGVKDYITRSANAGKKWAVACDEPGDASHALRPDWDAGNSHEDGRKNGIWGAFLAGGYGCEWYFGYQHDHSDLTCNDWRSRDHFWDYCRHSLKFMNMEFSGATPLPVTQMTNDNGLSSNSNDYCFAKKGDVYVIMLKSGGTTNVDLGTVAASFDVKWFDPRNGGNLQNGTVTQVSGPGTKNIGNAPNNTSNDWVVLVRRTGVVTTYTLNVENGTGDGEYAEGETASISASIPSGKVLDKWAGDVATVANIYAASTTLTMPANDITVTATFKDAPSGIAVTGFTLINADTDTDIGPLTNNATLNLNTLPTTNLNVRAETSGTIGSVRFGYDGNANYQTESVAPYALAGDASGDYNAWTPTLGSHTLTGTPYSEASGGGTAGTALTVSFNVVNQVANTAPVIDSFPWADPNPVTLPSGTNLNVMAIDDGLPNPPGALSYTWSKVSGPGTVTFGSVNGGTNGYSCPASFSTAGEYTIRVTVSDGDLTDTDTVIVTVQSAGNVPPEVDFMAPVDGAIFTEGEGVEVEVNAIDPDGSIANVKLYVDGQLVRQENSAPYTWGPGQSDALLTNMVAGTHLLEAVATDNDSATTSASIQIVVLPPIAAIPLPGRVEAEDYRVGGEGVGYHDTTTGNTGGAYRTDDVDIQVTGDATGAFNVGWVAAGEWLAYDVDVQATGIYTVTARVATSNTTNKTLHIEVDGVDVTGAMTYNTGGAGWQVYQDVVATGVQLSQGLHTLKVVFDSASQNLNYIEVSTSTPVNVPPSVSLTAPSNGATFTAPASIAISANASDSDGTVTKVEFFAGSTKIAEDTTAPYSIAWNSVGAGSYVLTAVATDDDGASTTSAGIGVTVEPGNTVDAYQVNSGGGNATPFVADAYVSGGKTYSTGAAIDVSGVTDPAPQAVYQSERYGNFSYTFPDLEADASYTVRLHLAEIYFSATGKRVFNVSINGAQVLSNMDIYAVAGAKNKAIMQEFDVTADGSGQIAVQFSSVVENPKCSGIEILGGAVPPPPPPPNEDPSVNLTAPSNGANFTAPASITVSADASDSDGTVTKVEFFAGSTKIGEDTSAPYSISWNNVSAGNYTLTAKATDDDGASTTSEAVTVSINDPTPTLAVTSLTLVNADTNADIGPLEDGDTINFSVLPTRNLSVRANVSGSPGSVRFAYDGNGNYQTENYAPYALVGDTSGDYKPWTPTLGSHTLTATPYSGSNAGGTAGTAVTVSFTVTE